MKRIVSLALILAGSLATTTAQLPTTWTTRGVGGGGSFYGPTISPFNANEYYLVSDMSEVFHTTDFGNTYQLLPFVQIQGSSYASVQFTADPNIRYSLSSYGGNDPVAVKTTDGGMTWVTLPGDPHYTYYNVWTDFGHPQTVIIGSWSIILISTNGGLTFNPVNTPQPYATGGLIGGGFSDGNSIYLGTSEGLMVSTNAGATFINAGYPGIPTNQFVRSFAGAKVGGQTRFFALTVGVTYAGQNGGTDYWGNYRGIYSMDKATGPWVPRANGTDTNTDFLMFIAMATNDLNTVYAGGSKSGPLGYVPNIMKTTDAGLHWTNVFTAVNNANITTGWTGQGGDRGWSYGEVVFGLAVAPTNSAKIVFTDMGFVHHSTNAGLTWEQAYTSPADQHPPGTTAIAKKTYHSIGAEDTSVWQVIWSDPTNLFAAFTDISGIRSTDGGITWSFNYTGHSANTMYRAFIQPATGAIYAGTSDIHDMYQSTRLADDPLNNADANGKIIYSTDKGATWNLLHNFGHPVFWLCPDANNPNTIYASVVHSTLGGIFVSTNIQTGASSTWTKLPNPPRTEGHPACVQALNDGQLVATYSGHRNPAFTASSGVFLYHPAQGNWTDVSSPSMYYWTKDIVLDPTDANQNTWYVGVFSGWGGPPNGLGGLYRTTNRGTNWSKINSLDRVTSLTINPSNPTEAYLTTETSGLWNTTNLHAATPTFNLVANYPFRQPERVFYNPYDANELWITSFGNGLAQGRTAPPTPKIQFRSADLSVAETGGTVTLGVNLTGPTNSTLTAQYATTDGTAVAPANYSAASGTITWTPNNTNTQIITIPIHYTNAHLGNLTFTVNLTNATGGAVLGSPTTATMTILEIDPGPPNYPPVAEAQTFNVIANVPTPITLTGHDDDNDSLTFNLLSQPTRGTLTGIPPNLMFYPATNSLGSDGFFFNVSDDKTNSTTAVVQFGINPTNTTPPTVTLVTPINHTIFVSPTNITLTATANANDTITAISFLNGAYPIVNLTTPPYTYTWTNPPAGTYTLFAKASVSTNSRSFSTPVVITVLGAQPRLTIQANPLLVKLAWPIGVDGWLVQGATNLTGPWLLTGQTVIDNATQHQTTLTPERQQYYRLTLPR